MHFTYDSEVDAAYIYLTQEAAGQSTVSFSINEVSDTRTAGEINLDFNAKGELVGIEILNAKASLPDGFLD